MSPEFSQWLFYAGLAGGVVFAISGALAAAERRLDILGFVLLGVVTGIGGGTIRDLILGVEVFWVVNSMDLAVCIAAAILTWVLAPRVLALSKALVWADAAGLALFSVVGAAKAHSLGAAPLVVVVMGMLTPTFGSVIRDLLLDRQPVLLGPEVYVTAALSGAVSFLLLVELGGAEVLSMLVAIAVAFGVRSAALLFGWQLPKFSR